MTDPYVPPPCPTYRDLSGIELDGRYRLVRLVGAGGMGSVYEAVHITLGTQVAVKVLKPDLGDNEKIRLRFLREARAASTIRNDHIVRATDFGQTSLGLVYFVMEFLVGRDLQDVLAETGSLGWPRFRPILFQLIGALAAAHDRGIVHRDIKPANVFLIEHEDDPEFVKVLDFGIAKIVEEDSDGLTATDELFGTVSYMAPELAEGRAASAASDIYSLGVLMYYVLTGELPFGNGTPFQILARHIQHRPSSPRALVPELPVEVEATILAMMAKQPELRPSSLSEVLEDLERVPTPAVDSPRPWSMKDGGRAPVSGVLTAPSLGSGSTAQRFLQSALSDFPLREDTVVERRPRIKTQPSAMAEVTEVALEPVVVPLAAAQSASRAERSAEPELVLGEVTQRHGATREPDPLSDSTDDIEHLLRSRRMSATVAKVLVLLGCLGGIVAVVISNLSPDESRESREPLYRAVITTPQAPADAQDPDPQSVSADPGATERAADPAEPEEAPPKALAANEGEEPRGPHARTKRAPALTDRSAKTSIRRKIASKCRPRGSELVIRGIVTKGRMQHVDLVGFEGVDKDCASQVVKAQKFPQGKARPLKLAL